MSLINKIGKAIDLWVPHWCHTKHRQFIRISVVVLLAPSQWLLCWQWELPLVYISRQLDFETCLRPIEQKLSDSLVYSMDGYGNLWFTLISIILVIGNSPTMTWISMSFSSIGESHTYIKTHHWTNEWIHFILLRTQSKYGGQNMNRKILNYDFVAYLP